jgi:hypothetical protein
MPFFENMFRKTNAKFDIIAPIKPEAVSQKKKFMALKKTLKANQKDLNSNP